MDGAADTAASLGGGAGDPGTSQPPAGRGRVGNILAGSCCRDPPASLLQGNILARIPEGWELLSALPVR
jgi:hypothetical protein